MNARARGTPKNVPTCPAPEDVHGHTPPTAVGGQAGLTLVETLVVLGIVAVAAGAVMVSLGAPGRGLAVETAARALARDLDAASAEALTTARRTTLAWTSEGWRLGEHAGHALERGVRLVAEPPEGRIVLEPDATGAAMTWYLRTDEDADWAVRFDGLGAHAAPTEARP